MPSDNFYITVSVLNFYEYFFNVNFFNAFDYPSNSDSTYMLLYLSMCQQLQYHCAILVFATDIVKDSIKQYTAEDTNKFKTIIVFDCRGVEPIAFDARVGTPLYLFI